MIYLHNIFIIPSIALHIHIVFFNIRKEVKMIRKGVIVGLTPFLERCKENYVLYYMKRKQVMFKPYVAVTVKGTKIFLHGKTVEGL
jgi:hypothetical protein